MGLHMQRRTFTVCMPAVCKPLVSCASPQSGMVPFMFNGSQALQGHHSVLAMRTLCMRLVHTLQLRTSAWTRGCPR
jgi:hypothetical protein